MARRVVLWGGGPTLVGAIVAALALLVPSASATSQRLAVSPQVEQALVVALHSTLVAQGETAPLSSIQLVAPHVSPGSAIPLAAFDAANQTYYATACVRIIGPLPELLRLHSTFPYSPLTAAPRSLEISCELFAKTTNGTWHVIQDSPSLGCGVVGHTLQALWDGVPACNAPVFDL
jgi:hypothetical protein